MFVILKKLIPTKIKLYLKSVYYFFLMHIKNADNRIVHLYLINNQKDNIRKIIKIKFFNNLFLIPKISRNAYLIQRTEKDR